MTENFNQQVIDEFRANGGRVGGWFEGARLLLLTTTGARSGRPHTTPLGYLPDGDRVLVIASAGGAPKHPAWYHNLVRNPEVTVEGGDLTYSATATVLSGAERDEMFARAVEADSGWADYQAKTSRGIPVVALAMSGPPNISSLAAMLQGIHDNFRREVSLIRKEIAESGGTLGAQLRVNCLTFCQGLQAHHTGEDGSIFPYVLRHHPELESTMEKLTAEHEQIAVLLAELQALLGGGTPQGLLTEFDRLAARLEQHLTDEEAALLPVLEAMG